MPPALSTSPVPAFRPVRRPVAVRAAGRAPHVAGLPDPPEFYRLEDVEIFAVGEQINSRGDAKVWTPAMLRAVERNFNLHAARERGRVLPTVASVPLGDPHRPDLGIDHDELQRHLDGIGAANAGLIESVRFSEEDGVLLGTPARVLAPVAEAVRDGKLVTVSSEIWEEPPAGMAGEGPVLKRVSLLGHRMPAVKTLRPLPVPSPDYQTYSEAGGTVTASHRPGRPIHFFAEATTMATKPSAGDNPFRQAWIDGLAGIPVTMTADQLAALPDDQLLALATAEESGEGGGGADRAAAEAELAAADPTMTAEQIKAMDDATFWAAYTQKTGKTAPSGGKPTVNTYAENRRIAAELAEAKQKLAEVMPVIQEFGEVKRQIEEATKAAGKAKDDFHQFTESEGRKIKDQRIDAVVDEALKWGVFTPGDDDTTSPARPSKRQRYKLMDHRTIAHTYAEQGTGREVKLTQLDLELAELEERIAEAKRKAPHGYAERIAQDRRPPNGNAPTPERLTQLLTLTPAGRAALALRNGKDN